MNSIDWYDFPQHYDFIFDTETQLEADFIEGVIDKYLDGKAKKLLEPGCGTGRLVRELAGRGYGVTGFDSNTSMLNYALQRTKRYSENVELSSGYLENFESKTEYDAAYCLIDTFRYLTTEKAACSHLRCVGNALRSGGIYILGFHLTNYEYRKCERERSIRKNKSLSIVCNLHSWPPNRKQRLQKFRSRMKVETTKNIKKYETTWMFRTYGPKQISSLFESIKNLEHIDTYTFDYNIHKPGNLGDGRLDCVFILRRK